MSATVRKAFRPMLPGLCIALAAFMASALEAPAYGPHESGIVYLLLPPLGLQMLILCIASVVTRQWRRAAAFAFCLQWLYGLTL